MGQEDTSDKQSKYIVDEQLQFGPVSTRGCNDVICCFLFLLNILAIFGIGAYGLNKGHPDRLLVGYDSAGRPCGKDDLADYPYVYLPALQQIQKSICLKNCPVSEIDDNTVGNKDVNNNNARKIWDSIQYKDTPGALKDTGIFTLNVATYQANINQIPSDDVTHVAVYQTKGYFGRVCLPYGDSQKIVLQKVSSAFGDNTTTLEKYISDIKTAWIVILGSVGVAFIIAFVYMVVLKYCSGLITWISIILYFSCIIALAILLLSKGKEKEDEGYKDKNSSLEKDGKNLKYLSYSVFAFAGLCAIVFLCLFNKIRLAIAIIKSAALFVSEVKSVFVVPPIITFFNMIFMGWWQIKKYEFMRKLTLLFYPLYLLFYWYFKRIVAFVFVYSVGDIEKSQKGPFGSVKWEKNTRYMLAYHIFGGMWINAFFNAVIQFVLATACALWYFNRPPHRPVYTGFFRGLTTHFGSLAYGSLILAIIQFVRFILEIVDEQARKKGAQKNACAKYLFKCVKCFIDCLFACVKYLNKNAYIQIALTGKSFCEAAKDAFQLIWSNPVKFGTIATLGNVFIFVGRIFIACVTGLICYVVLIKVGYYKENLFSPILPTVFCTIIGYFIGTFFMSVYGMGVDTIIQCTCYDEELTKKTGKDSKRCPEPLQQFLESRQQK